MTWYAVHHSLTGRLLSVGQASAPPVVDGALAAPLLERPDLSAVMWDAGARTFVARPAKVFADRVDDVEARFLADADFAAVWGGLNASRKAQLRTGMRRVLAIALGRERMRGASESTEIGG